MQGVQVGIQMTSAPTSRLPLVMPYVLPSNVYVYAECAIGTDISVSCNTSTC